MANAFRQPGTNEFKPDWKDRGDALEALLTKEEARAAQHSTTAAHYTSKAIVDAAWKIAERLGFKGGLTLETSMGTGNFLGLIPERIAGQTRFVGVELDSITARIAKALYPQETILQSGFEKVPLPDGEFVLSIGNPPFGRNSLRFQHKPELHGHSIHNQFFMASLDALQPGGLHVAVVSHHLLDAEGRDARLKMAAKADLLGAVRLPDSAFKENARTEVVTDLVAMQRRTPEAEREIQDLINATLKPGKSKEAEDARNKARRELRDKVPWLDTAEVRDPLGGEPMKVNRYFANNPDMVVGRLERSGKMHGQGEELNVKLEKPEQYQDLLDKAVERMPKDKIDLGKEVIDRTLERFTTLSDSIKIALRGLEPGHLEYSDKGELTQITERETAKGDFEPTKRVVTADTPWSRQLAMDNQGRWFTSEPKLDAKGAKVKQGTRNVYERKYFPNNEVPQSLRLGAARFERISDLTKLRDALRRQIELETQDAPPKMMEGNRGRLAAAYRAYTEAHGLLHEPRTMQLLNEMPDGPLLMSLESGFRPAVTNTKAARTGGKVRKPSAKPAAILSRRVILKYEPPTKAASPADALAISLSERGHIDVPRVAELLGIPEDKVGEALSAGDKPLAFYDPELQQWEARSAYLSGQVRRKLAAARGAGLEKNVQELEAVQPEEWTADQVTPLVGSNWIAPKHYEDFAKHLLGVDKATVQYSKATNSYNMLTEEYGDGKRVEWGTPDMPPDAILRGMLNSRLPKVMEPTYDQDGRITGERVDKEKSALVVLKAREIEQAFADWVYKDGERRRELVGAYNDKMNTHAPRQDDGRHLTLPGKSPDISLRRHIYNAIWRGIYSRNLLLDHVVGAGKTFAAIGRIMERRRMGLSQKPMIAVPNHLVEQWAAEALRLYPGAKVLAAGKSQFDKKSRRRLFARIATGDWDMVIVPHSSFGFIGISPETETRFLEDHLRVAQQALRDAEADSPGGRFKSYTVKQAERLVSQIEARMDALRGARRDSMLTFEQMGVDDLTVDEAHEFKNLFYTSRMTEVRGMGPPGGSQKAFDLYNKIKVLNESPTGSTTFLTGTPISNSAVEMYTMMRYLAAKELRELGLEHFDAWRSQFVSAEPKWEPTESGKGLKEVTRLGRSWSNMRALMNLYRSFTDSVTQEDINRQYKEDNNGEEFPIPKVATGDMQTHVVQPTPAQVGILEQVIDGFDHLDEIQDPNERNAERLRLMGRARKVSLDARVAEPGHPSKEEGGKLEVISNEVARIYKKWNADKGTQLIFLDRSVPKSRGDAAILKRYDELVAKRDDALAANDEEGFRRISDDLDKYDPNEMAELRRAQAGGWNAYQQIKDNLIARGIPADEIRFIQEANTDAEKKEMIDSVNAGETRVLIGSTQRMGPGMNAQERLVAGHHGDVTWKPSDIEQRRGRWIRQGNNLYDKYGKDFEVEEHNYVTERTIDAKMWDLNAEKLRMVNGIRKYDGAFNMEFADEEAVSMAEIAALASGDPLLMERVKLGGEIEKLEMQERGFRRKMNGIEDAVDRAKHAIAEYPAQIAATRAAADDMQARRDAVLAAAAKRSITIDGQSYRIPSEAYEAARKSIKDQKGDDENAKYKVNVDGADLTNQQAIEGALNNAFGDREPFDATIEGETYTRRWMAAKALAPKILEAADGGHKLGRMLGADLEAEIASSDKSTRIVLGVTDGGKTLASSHYHDIPKDLLTDAGTFTRAIEKALVEIDKDTRNVAISRATHLQERIDAAKKALPELEPQLNQQSPHTAKLQEYRAKLRDVINTLDARARAKAAGDDRPTADEYVEQAMRNLLASSRTAQGTGGLATTPQKAASIVEGLDKTQAKAAAQRNFESTIRYLFDNKDKLPTSGPAMEQFIDNVAERINKGIVKPGEINRSVETVHPNMTRAADLPYAHAQFAEELAARLADRGADPVETAAWIIWRANLIHHFWSDGVGKTSNALAAIPLMKAGRPLPIAAPMSEYVSFAPEKPFVPGSPGSHYTDHPGWERFNAYYHELARAADPGATAAVRNSPELQATEEEINALQRALARRDHPETIEEHPLVKRAYKLSNEFPLTNERPGYGTVEDRASSVYDFDGERVVGYDAAVDRLIAHAKSFAPGGEVRNERKAYILTGPGGAGKSTIAANPILRNAHAALVDADEAKKVIPGFRGGLGASAVHGESTDIMYGDRGMPGSVFARLVGEGANLVIGKIGHNPDSIRRLEHELAQDGYDVNLINLEINPEEAFRRRIGRFLATLRVNSSGYRGEVAHGMGRQSAENYYIHKAEGKFHEAANLDVNGPVPRVIDGADTSLPALIGIRTGRPGHGEADRGAPGSAEGETDTEGLTPAFAEPRSLYTSTPEFKRWFGDSKVTKNGKPQVVYHGGANVFEQFSGDAFAGWATARAKLANEYAGKDDRGTATNEGAVYPLFMSIRKPANISHVDLDTTIMDDSSRGNRALEDIGMSYDEASKIIDNQTARGLKYYFYPKLWMVVNSPEFAKLVADRGYDGIRATEDGQIVWAALRPEQIKSATGNAGTFDPNNPNMLRESGSPWSSDRASRDLGPHNFVEGRPVAAQAQDHVLFMGRTTDNEHLLAVDHRGKAVANFAGTRGGVNLSADATNKMLDPTNQIVVHHNHPSNGPLSDVDLSMLGMPGIKSIWAHGHEGRVTRAALTPFGRTLMGRNPEQNVGALGRLADLIGQQHIQPLLAGLVESKRIEPTVADHLHAFLVGDILRRAGLIDYHTSNAFEAEIEKHGLEPYIQRAADAVRKSTPNVATANPVPGDDRRSQTVFRHPGDVGAAFERRAEPPARRPEPGVANRAGGADGRQQAPPVRQLSFAFSEGNPNYTGERITGVAVRDPETGEWHDIAGTATHSDLLEHVANGKGVPFEDVEHYQDGFVTSHGRFVTREEAAVIARDAGQLDKEAHEDDRGQYLAHDDLKPGTLEDTKRRYGGAGGGGGATPPGGPGTAPSTPSARTSKMSAAFERATDLFDEAQLRVVPMAVGSDEARAVAKDYANEKRLAQYEWSRKDDVLKKEFTLAQQERMWTAADEENGARLIQQRTGVRAPGVGLDRLTPSERDRVDSLVRDANDVFQQARNVGIIDSEGMAYYAPRMVVMMDEEGHFRRPTAAPGERVGEGVGPGFHTSTPQMKHRKYATAAETEAAAKKHFGENAQLARNIRALPLATAKLQEAVAARTLINKIKSVGDLAGREAVAVGAIPDADGWFTLEHPAFKIWRPKLRPATALETAPFSPEGKRVPVTDEDGNVIMERVPLYIRNDFKGPLAAVLGKDTGKIYQALMAIKGKSMAAIMYSPVIHNLVEWSRALPAAPLKVFSTWIYWEGNRAKNDLPTMREAISNGLVPIGKRFFNQDITSIMEEPNIAPGRSLSAKVLGFIPGLFNPKAGEAVKAAVDKAGDVWHNKLLWDRIGDLQMGLYVNFRSHLIHKGFDTLTASRMAAHFANRYAGALPIESMSVGARKVANVVWFSRSFTVGNLGAMKDMLTGLPKDIQAQIDRDSGPQSRAKALSFGRRKAVGIILLDIALGLVTTSLLQDAFKKMRGDEDWTGLAADYGKRFIGLVQHAKEHPFETITHPMHALWSLSSTATNEPRKREGSEARILLFRDAHGRMIYGRNPMGKIGEEFYGWPSAPGDMFLRKLSQFVRGPTQALLNDKYAGSGFDRATKIWRPDPEGWDWVINGGRIVAHIAGSFVPIDALASSVDFFFGRKEDWRTDVAKATAPLAGISISKGHPGGPGKAEEEYRSQQRQFDKQFGEGKARPQYNRPWDQPSR